MTIQAILEMLYEEHPDWTDEEIIRTTNAIVNGR